MINQQLETDQEELVTDSIQIATVFSAKLNGKQKSKVQNPKKDFENG